LDLVRIGLEETIAETLVWIGVEADSLTPASGNVVVALCEEILRKAGGLTSVRVEIRETALCRSALHPPQQLSSPMRFKYGEPFTASIGLPISCHSQPHIIGTGGLYMRDGENGAPLLLTCQHVVSPDNHARLSSSHVSSTGGETVELMTPAVFSRHLSGIKDQMRLLAQVIDMTEQRELANLRPQMVNIENDDQIQQAAIDGSDNDPSLSLKSIPETVHLKLWRSELAELQALYDEYQTDFGESAGRELGTVHCHPPISMNSEAYCIDWALIRLNNRQVPESGAVNGIQLGHMDDLGLLNKAGFSVSLSLDLCTS